MKKRRKVSLSEKLSNRAIEMRNYVREWRKSGLSQADFCRKYKLCQRNFSYWKVRFLTEKAKEKVNFVPVIPAKEERVAARFNSLESKRSSQAPSLKLEVLDRFKIEVPENFSAPTLTRLVATLEAL